MSNDDWTIQVSYKLPDGTLVNVRAVEPLALATNLGVLRDTVQEVVATGNILTAGANAAPVVGGNVTPIQQQPQQAPPPDWAAQQQAVDQYTQQQVSQPDPPQQQQPAPQQGAGPHCAQGHGPAIWKSGVGKASGKPYKGWFCPKNVDGCKPTFVN